ncbi:FAD:protein FMN transferase [Thalassolituus marinus]|uniref:FAD:protein FMN transferase n=1 Tax=Thalassolituus marinus TaxID=671053 RepID=A0ABS7ZMD8_9GAMM|nr:FAD:protein FMN transferase [Thalassolituus marinus]MCA6062363.1 FAD:protein FMN transferase [Thalassolituus marinus]
MLRTLTLALSLVLAACDQKAELNHIAGSTMGTTYHVSCNCPDPAGTLKDEIDSRLVEINKIMSTYDPDSELSRINSYPGAFPATFTISEELATVIRQALDIHARSNDYFDITVGPLVNLWGFGPQASIDKAPDEHQLQQAMSETGSSAITLSGHQLTLTEARYIDLSGIAKGWAVDDIGALLEARNITGYLVEIGGELRTRGAKPGEAPWRVAIERPSANPGDRLAELIIEPGDAAVATSGDYRNYFESNGVRYSHTINPSTGRPITHTLASVTVIHEDCGQADAWATALNVAGPEEGMQIAEQNQLSAFMIIREGDSFTEKASTAFLNRFPDYRPQGQE